MTTRPNRHLFKLTIAQIRQLKELGVISAAPENRTVIADNQRPRGTSEGYWNSLRKGINPGQMLGYSLDDCKKFATAIATNNFGGHGMFVTDFGHRFAWLTLSAESIKFKDGHTLASLEKEGPDDYAALMSTEIAISMSTHSDKEFLKDFAKDEYLEVNTTSTPLEGGELARGLPENPSRAEPNALAKNLLETYYPKTPVVRDKRLLVETGLCTAAARGTNDYHGKVTGDDSLLDAAKELLTDEEGEIARAALIAWTNAEEGIRRRLEHVPSPDIGGAQEEIARRTAELARAEKGGKAAAKTALKEAEARLKLLTKADEKLVAAKEKQRKILDGRVMDHASTGPILYGFRDAVVADRKRKDGLSTEVDKATSIFRRWMEMSLASPQTWKANRKDVTTCYGENNSARYYNETRFKAGWTRMKTMLPAA